MFHNSHSNMFRSFACRMIRTLLLAAWMLAPALSETCTFINSCKCKFENGSIIDLSSVGWTDGARFQNVTPAKREPYHYYYNPCYNFKLGNTGECSGGVAVCQVDNKLQEYQDCGDQSSAFFVWNSALNAVVLTYHHQPRTTRVVLKCSPNSDTDHLNVTGETGAGSMTYDMELTSKCACPDLCNNSHLSFGTALIIIFFVFAFCYLCLGIVYNHLVLGAHGLELIPNYEFWKDFPLLVRDGCVYVSSGCKTETAYERI